MPRSGRLALCATIAAIGAAALHYGWRGGGNAPDGAVVGTDESRDPTTAIPPPSPDTKGTTQAEALSALVRSEPRDGAWATRSETAIHAGMSRIPFMDMGGSLKIQCSTSVCEVAGTAPEMLGGKDLGQYWGLLQSQLVQKPLNRAGLEMISASFGGPGDPYGYVMYYRRTG